MQVVLLERVAKLGQMGEVVQRPRRLRPQLPAAAGQGAARHRGQPQALRDRARPARGPQPRAEEGGREGRRQARRPDLRGDPLRLRRRRALRLGHHPRHRRRGDRGRLQRSTAARWCSTSRSRSSACTRSPSSLHPEVEATITHQRRPQPGGGRAPGLRQDHPGAAGRGRGRRRVRHPGALRRHRRRRRRDRPAAHALTALPAPPPARRGAPGTRPAAASLVSALRRSRSACR